MSLVLIMYEGELYWMFFIFYVLVNNYEFCSFKVLEKFCISRILLIFLVLI